MEKKKKVALAAVPVLGVFLLACALCLAPRRDLNERVKTPRTSRPNAVPEPGAAYAVAQPPERPRPSPESAVSHSMDEARLRSTFESFRTAVATGNGILERALREVLLRDRADALRVAEEELSRARSPVDRDISMRAVEALRR